MNELDQRIAATKRAKQSNNEWLRTLATRNMISLEGKRVDALFPRQEPVYLTRKDERKLEILLSLALAALVLAIIMALPSVEGPQTMRVYGETEVGR